jgi:hypothetical protein
VKQVLNLTSLSNQREQPQGVFMKKLSVLIAATIICSQSHATDLVPEGSLTLFTNYSKVEGQKSTYTGKATLSISDWENLPSAEVFFPMDTGICFSGYAWTAEWVISAVVDKDEAYTLTAGEVSEDGEEIYFAVQNAKKQVKSFTIHRCL